MFQSGLQIDVLCFISCSHNLLMIKLRINTLSDQIYPAQMLEVAGDLLRAPANIEIPELALVGCTPRFFRVDMFFLQVLFELARFHAPSTIFLDELESLMSQRGTGGGG